MIILYEWFFFEGDYSASYGSNRSLKVNLSGQALHARQLSLLHPISGELIEAIAPLPAEFTKLLEVLRNRTN